MAVYRLDENLWFPDPRLGEKDGLVAVGGDLSVNRLLLAYSYGFFPWFSFRFQKEPLWYCPQDRYVIFPKEIHISHSMKQLMRQKKFVVTINCDFEGVIRNCSMAGGRIQEEAAWLGLEMMEAYTELHRQGYAASVEVWDVDDASSEKTARKLVGGLYGVAIRNAFFGESMFSLMPNASKLALIHLAQNLECLGAHFIDCQFETPHLNSMGGRHISYEKYMEILNNSPLPTAFL
ncbi:MAG: leucyl/phenylalanyl-tRNA--protein transferase [Prevotella sp.]|nr:leucyl/phenylalanyl-tRNA--protein transferase [Prevotella sp.]